jgi:hypothetical protein
MNLKTTSTHGIEEGWCARSSNPFRVFHFSTSGLINSLFVYSNKGIYTLCLLRRSALCHEQWSFAPSAMALRSSVPSTMMHPPVDTMCSPCSQQPCILLLLSYNASLVPSTLMHPPVVGRTYDVPCVLRVINKNSHVVIVVFVVSFH